VKQRISTSLSRPLIESLPLAVLELPPVILDVPSSVAANKELKDALNIAAVRPPGRSNGYCVGLSEDSLSAAPPPPESGGCINPIDFAMHDITSSRRSKSSVDMRAASRSPPDDFEDAMFNPWRLLLPIFGVARTLNLRVNGWRVDETSPAVCKSPALAANRDKVGLKGVMGECARGVDDEGCDDACPEPAASSAGLSGILAEIGTRGTSVLLLPIVVLLDMESSLGMRRGRPLLRLGLGEGPFRVP